MNIVKQSTGNVVLTDSSDNILKVFVMVNALDVINSNEIIIKYGMNQWTSLFADQIKNTQIEPSSAVPFSGNAYQLVSLLSSSFFFELSGGGSTPSLADVLAVGNSAGINYIDLDNNDLQNANVIDFNLATSNTAGIGQLAWNDVDGTLDLGLKGGNVTLQLGQEQIARVVNKTTPNIDLLEANYQVVKIVGATGQRLSVALAQADNTLNSATTLGVVTETILKNQEGFICTSGQVHEINTTGSLQGETWADGDVLYLSTTTAGMLTNKKPLSNVFVIGFVEYKHAIHGKIFVRIDSIASYPIEIQAACSDETTALTAGTNKVTFRMPCAMTVTGVRASLTTAQTSGNIFTVDINENGTSILSTKLTIDNTEKTSVTAATAPVISDSSLADDSEITVDIDQIGDGTAKGLKITLIGVR